MRPPKRFRKGFRLREKYVDMIPKLMESGWKTNNLGKRTNMFNTETKVIEYSLQLAYKKRCLNKQE